MIKERNVLKPNYRGGGKGATGAAKVKGKKIALEKSYGDRKKKRFTQNQKNSQTLDG